MGRLTIPSPLGPLTLTSTDGALTALDWGEADRSLADAVVEEAARQLADYFSGARQMFDLPLRPHGTPFQHRVWAAMLDIPYGATATYGDLARRLGTAGGRRRLRSQSAADRHSLPSRSGWGRAGRLFRPGRPDDQEPSAESGTRAHPAADFVCRGGGASPRIAGIDDQRPRMGSGHRLVSLVLRGRSLTAVKRPEPTRQCFNGRAE
jgi:hypothetical protein